MEVVTTSGNLVGAFFRGRHNRSSFLLVHYWDIVSIKACSKFWPWGGGGGGELEIARCSSGWNLLFAILERRISTRVFSLQVNLEGNWKYSLKILFIEKFVRGFELWMWFRCKLSWKVNYRILTEDLNFFWNCTCSSCLIKISYLKFLERRISIRVFFLQVWKRIESIASFFKNFLSRNLFEDFSCGCGYINWVRKWIIEFWSEFLLAIVS